MAIPTSEQAVERLINGIERSGEKVREGVAAVTDSPMEKAAAKGDKYLEGVQNSVDKWKRNLKKVSLEEWKRLFTEKGIPAMAAGARASREKMLAFYNKYLPFLKDHKARIDKMPDVTVEQRINKMVENVRGIMKFKND